MIKRKTTLILLWCVASLPLHAQSHRGAIHRAMKAAGGPAAPVAVGPPCPDGAETMAEGLNNPRGLQFAPDGRLHVAEAGIGGTLTCFEGELGTSCLGSSGTLTRIDVKKHTQEVYASGLPSIAAPDGTGALGPADVSFVGGLAYVPIGGGGDAEGSGAAVSVGGGGGAKGSGSAVAADGAASPLVSAGRSAAG